MFVDKAFIAIAFHFVIKWTQTSKLWAMELKTAVNHLCFIWYHHSFLKDLSEDDTDVNDIAQANLIPIDAYENDSYEDDALSDDLVLDDSILDSSILDSSILDDFILDDPK